MASCYSTYSVDDFLPESFKLINQIDLDANSFERKEDVLLSCLEAFAIFHATALLDLMECARQAEVFDSLKSMAKTFHSRQDEIINIEPESRFPFKVFVPKHYERCYLLQIANRATIGNPCLLKEDKKKLVRTFKEMFDKIQDFVIRPVLSMNDVRLAGPGGWDQSDTLDMILRIKAKLSDVLVTDMKIF